MRVRRLPNGIQVDTPAKLNLFLEVHGKRGDGFHEIETIMTSVSLYDTVVFRRLPENPGKITFAVSVRSGIPAGSVPADATNLLVRAVRSMQERYSVQAGAAIELTKRIPTEAGLGGGSSDAAAGLVAATLGWNIGTHPEDLLQIGSQLGSDVPFFLSHSPAICRGRGEQTEPAPLLKMPSHFVIIKPDMGVGTAAVYGSLHVPPSPRSLPKAIDQYSMFNRLQEAAEKMYGELTQVRRSCLQLGLHNVMMTGSGSALFSACRSRKHAVRSANFLRHAGMPNVYVVSATRHLAWQPSLTRDSAPRF